MGDSVIASIRKRLRQASPTALTKSAESLRLAFDVTSARWGGRFGWMLVLLGSLLLVGVASLLPRSQVFVEPIPEAESLRNWSFLTYRTAEKVSGDLAPERLIGAFPSTKLTGAFSQRHGVVSAVLEFTKPQDWSAAEEIVFRLYADAGVGKRAKRYIILDVEEPTDFGWGFYVINDTGEFKGTPEVKINWTGWNEIAVPLRVIHRDLHPLWNDETSLHRIKRIRFDLQFLGELGSQSRGGSLYIANVRIVSKHVPPVSKVSIFLLSVPFMAALFMITQASKMDRAASRLTAVAIAVKSGVAIVTPLSSDFISSFFAGAPVLPSSNPLHIPLFEGGPLYFLLIRGMYHLWSLLPIDHPAPLAIFPGYWSYPGLAGRIGWERNEFFHFLGTPGSWLVVYLLKFPNLVADIGSGLLIFAIVLRITGTRTAALFALGLWFLNPLTLIISEMWAPVDPVWVFFALLATFFFMRKQLFWSGVSLGLAIATRTAPLLLLPVFAVLLMKPREGMARRMIKFVAPAIVLPLAVLIVTVAPGVPAEHIPEIGEPYYLPGPVLAFFDFPIAMGIVAVSIYYLTLFHLGQGPGGFARWPSAIVPQAVLGLLVSIFAFSKFHFHMLLWFVPFLILDVVTREGSQVSAVSFAILAVVPAFLVAGPYFSTYGASVFFVPTVFPWMKAASRMLFSIGNAPGGLGVTSAVTVIRSMLTGVSLVYAALVLLHIYREARKTDPARTSGH